MQVIRKMSCQTSFHRALQRQGIAKYSQSRRLCNHQLPAAPAPAPAHSRPHTCLAESGQRLESLSPSSDSLEGQGQRSAIGMGPRESSEEGVGVGTDEEDEEARVVVGSFGEAREYMAIAGSPRPPLRPRQDHRGFDENEGGGEGDRHGFYIGLEGEGESDDEMSLGGQSEIAANKVRTSVRPSSSDAPSNHRLLQRRPLHLPSITIPRRPPEWRRLGQ